MDKDTFEELIAIYDEALHTGSFYKYYKDNMELLEDGNEHLKHNLELLKELYQNNFTISIISLGSLLNAISHIKNIPEENFQTIIEVNNSQCYPPLDVEEYKKDIKNRQSQINVNINYKSSNEADNIYIFDISFCSSIDLNGLDNNGNPIIAHLKTEIIDEKEPTSVLYINKELENIPLDITFNTFLDVYYSSFSEDNLNTFYKAIINCLYEVEHKPKMFSLKPLN